jgi:hypothetical protein
MILEAAVGPDGAFEAWMPVTPENEAHCLRLVARAPHRWRIVEA